MLQQSGNISLSQIGAEGGDSNPISIGDLYNGGSYFPSTTTSPVNGALPSSGSALSFSNFYGCIKRTTQVSGLSNRLNNVIWTGSQFVAVGDGGVIMYSSNGTSWTNANTTSTLNIQGIAWSGSEYCITTIDTANSNYFKVYRSTDLSSWSLVYNTTSSYYSSAGVYSIAYGASKFSAISSNGDRYYSTNSTGTAWTIQTPAIGSDNYPNKTNNLVWNGSIFVNCHGLQPRTSTDGISYSGVGDYGLAPNYPTASFLIGWNGTVFLASTKVVSTGSTVLVKSTDGITWSSLETGTNTVYAAGLANSGTSYTMTTTANKIRRSSQSVTAFTDLTAYGNNPYAMVASSTTAVLLAYNGSTYDISTISL